MFLPLVFKGDGMRCLIVGGGEVALRKMEMLLSSGCAVTILAPDLHDDIRSAAETQKVRWLAREFRGGDCKGYQLAIAATARREINRAVFNEAVSLGIPVNVVDDPELCTVIFPAIWQHGPLTISVSTSGVAPFMAAAVRDRFAAQGASLARWTEIAGKFRAIVRSEIRDWKEKNLLYKLFADAIQSGDPPDPPETNRLSDWKAWLEKLGG